jgi:hypothetical protein
MPAAPPSLARRSIAGVVVSAGPPLGGLLKPPSDGGLCEGKYRRRLVFAAIWLWRERHRRRGVASIWSIISSTPLAANPPADQRWLDWACVSCQEQQAGYARRRGRDHRLLTGRMCR